MLLNYTREISLVFHMTWSVVHFPSCYTHASLSVENTQQNFETNKMIIFLFHSKNNSMAAPQKNVSPFLNSPHLSDIISSSFNGINQLQGSKTASL